MVFALIHHQAMEERHGLVQLTRLEIGVAHIELHLLCLVGGERSGVSLLVDGQRLFVLLALEQVIGIEVIGMSRPSTAWVVVHKLDDLGGTIGLAEIHGADCLVILRIDPTLCLGVVHQIPILGKSGQSRAIFLVLEQQHALIKEGFGIIVIYMLLR